MRLFTGISLPTDVVENLSRLLDHLRSAAQLKWSAPYNLHITAKFIGEWPEDRLPELTESLASASKCEPIAIAVRGLGWFPNPHAPRVLWAGVQAATLADLAASIDARLEPLGVPRETKPYSAHLTLARIKDPVPLGPLRTAIAALTSSDFGSFTATQFHLYKSQPGPAGSIYSRLSDFPFQAQ